MIWTTPIEQAQDSDQAENKLVEPRVNGYGRINWDDYFMMIALVTAQRSPDPNTQVGAVLTKDNIIIGTGYNGLPRGIRTFTINWARDAKNPLLNKYPYVVHAEKNAIHNATVDTNESILYTTLFPCNECAKDIIQAGIKSIFYLKNKYKNSKEVEVSEWMLSQVDINCKQFEWNMKPDIIAKML